jgi:hypothetical protein
MSFFLDIKTEIRKKKKRKEKKRKEKKRKEKKGGRGMDGWAKRERRSR